MSAAPGDAAEHRHLLGSLLASPKLCACVLGAAAAHVGLTAAGLGGWSCPMLNATGWPCPGCGLGRACVLLFHREWAAAIKMHAFAPLLVVTLGLMAAALFLPTRGRAILLAGVNWIEERTPIVPALLGALLFYWIGRFALDAVGFRELVR